VARAVRAQRDGERARAGVDEDVAGHHRLGRFQAELAQVGDRAPEHGRRGRALEHGRRGRGILGLVLLDVGIAAVVVDDAVQVDQAERVVLLPACLGAVSGRPRGRACESAAALPCRRAATRPAATTRGGDSSAARPGAAATTRGGGASSRSSNVRAARSREATGTEAPLTPCAQDRLLLRSRQPARRASADGTSGRTSTPAELRLTKQRSCDATSGEPSQATRCRRRPPPSTTSRPRSRRQAPDDQPVRAWP
jgi:hypothetical protein